MKFSTTLTLGLFLSLIYFACSPGTENKDAAATAQAEAAPEPEPEPEPEPYDWTKADRLVMACGDSVNLGKVLFEYASNLDAQKIPYTQQRELFQDCSGMFLRMIDSLKQNCPEFAYPDRNVSRQSRELAKWYSEQGNFIRIKDPIAAADTLLKPGTVMFFGRPGAKQTDTLAMDDLWTREKGVFHMGIVVNVERDDEGVKNIHMFHGRTSGKPAAITKYHPRKPSRGNPPYGNGSEEWVAAAPIIHPAE